jgi:hypothetical protein
MRHTIAIPNWHPRRLNELLGVHYGTRSRRKRQDREMIAGYALLGGVPEATTPRRVSLLLTLAPWQRRPDPDC